MVDPASQLDSVFDEFLDLALRGKSVDVDEFLRERGAEGQKGKLPLDALGAAISRGTVLAEPVPDWALSRELPCEQIGDFRLIRHLGQGGMGVVYLAEQVSLSRLVALKLLRISGPESSERIAREARAFSRLKSPHVVRVIATGFEREQAYLAMELIPGRGLDERLAEQPGPSIPERLQMMRDICRGLEVAHREGVIHRDVKPSNVRVRPDGSAVLLDFGLAKVAFDPSMSRAGQFKGTPHYASPEQVRGESLDERTDIYALGAMFYECVTGAPPFSGKTTEDVLRHVLNTEPERPRRSRLTVSKDLETVVLKAMEKNPADRYESVASMRADIEAILEWREISARRLSPIRRGGRWIQRHKAISSLGFIVFLCILAVATVSWLEESRSRKQIHSWLEEAEEHGKNRNFAEALEAINQVIGRKPSSDLLLERNRLQDARLQSELQTLLEGLSDDIQAFREGRGEEAQLIREITSFRNRAVWIGLDEASTQSWQALEGRLVRLAEELDGLEVTIVDRAERARAHQGLRVEAELLLSEISIECYRRAFAQGDALGMSYWRDRCLALDLRLNLNPTGDVQFFVEPMDAQVQLYRFVDASLTGRGESSRLALTPVSADADWNGRLPWSLRVLESLGPMRRGDEIVELEGEAIRDSVFVVSSLGGPSRVADVLRQVDGEDVHANDPTRWTSDEAELFVVETAEGLVTQTGREIVESGVQFGDALALARVGDIDAVVWRGGEYLEFTLPPGLDLVTSASVPAGGDVIDLDSDHELEQGSYLALVASDGYEPARVPFLIANDETTEVSIEMVPAQETLSGFVFVPAGELKTEVAGTVDVDSFWMQVHEVTVKEYLDFVNDIGGEDQAPQRRAGAPTWPKDSTGQWFVPEPLERIPVTGVRWGHAREYARWLSNEKWEFDLPTDEQWTRAAKGVDDRRYPFGNDFLPSYAKSARSAPTLGFENVLSYPIDESPFGIFDLAGSVAEWTLGWKSLDEEGPVIRASHFGAGIPEAFEIMHRQVTNNVFTGYGVGFRLIAKRR